jgi:hypothetical protein
MRINGNARPDVQHESRQVFNSVNKYTAATQDIYNRDYREPNKDLKIGHVDLL